MKTSTYIYFGLLLTVMAGCKKGTITQVGDPAGGALIKFVHAAPGSPAIDGFVNNTKITPLTNVSVTDNQVATSIATGISYSYLGSATTYLGLFPSSNYAAVPAGSTVIKVVVSTPVPALKSPQTSAVGTNTSVTQSTTSGSAYSVFAIGLPGSATAPLGIKVVEDKFPAAESGKAYVRFAHLIPNGGAVDVKAFHTPTGVTKVDTAATNTNVAYGTVTDFVAVNVNPTSTTNYTFQMFLTGTTTKLGPISGAVPLAPGRYYTILARGLAADYPVPGTSITLKATARPTLPVTDPNTKLPEIYFNPISVVYYTNK
ncbi:uncharacterized protein DUF4397 [Mucilaginibacter yixingensis]|uniref:Uncharacterized protein DUF4397 n=1 Tax=Mucilaginibacter yixingensis TaxID=1295612 RepID=A0A2T5JBD2_9SPHI|nr:DUF4397 domain-containing protein [Mucilaginibacter yixingensis]PTQ98172.1 uncharacterized protein DUF4397 [Mucilaginibacter yixingensis]